jgi:uncharacterized protein YqgV (UPF0045/DUF77 family)
MSAASAKKPSPRRKAARRMRSALAIQCIPMGVNSRAKAWAMVDKAIAAIEARGLEYTVGPFETVVEGPLEKLFEAAWAAHGALLEAGSPKVATYMKLWSGPALGSAKEKVAKFRKRGH